MMNIKGILKKFSVFLVFAFLLNAGYGVNGEATAEDIDAKIKALEQQVQEIAQKKKQRESEIENLQGDVAQQDYLISLVSEEIEGVKEKINVQSQIITEQQNLIINKQLEIDELELDIENTELEIEENKLEIERLNLENEDNIRQFGQIIRTMYMTGDFDTVSMLMGATDFFDLLVRTEILQNVSERTSDFMTELLASVEHQEELIRQLEAEELSLSNKKTVCEREKSELEAELTELDLKKKELEEERNAEEIKLNGYAGEKAELRGAISELRTANAADSEVEEAANAEVAKLIKEKQRLSSASQKVYSADGFIWPLDNGFKMITTYFGYDGWRSGNHYGIDVGNGGINGANIYAVQSGTVIVSRSNNGWGGGYGDYVVIDHGGGISTLYAHMQAGSPRFSEGAEVEQGDVLGVVGSTGWATGPHLHFEVRVNGTAVDPFNYSYS